ncbi:MAG: bifunctional (p)ppGpp synthetase/guanosine-3',5'-bis(diphosphate) 3'-pyrophosphohydrolase [Erysipelotrichaceae bacterium]|nr:bifunctional (p)ppGpp synthetase/guanosine-3',5'-bis(diphosphate) 3'-pyrophosphohydrolase [Erysipelotrichaceae bacterium]
MEENKVLKVNGGYPLHTFEDLKSVFDVYISNEEDRNSIRRAYDFVIEKHKGQLRKSGEPYYHHLIEVAYILATLRGGPATICAGLLHDVVEDTDVTVEEIEAKWGSDVAKIVGALTKIQRLKLSKINSEDFEAEDHRKIFLGMAQDVRVILVKLADRLHNMRTLEALPPDRQIALSRETLDVFVPIAHRLGINIIKSELEDLCLKYLEPEKFEEIVRLLNKRSRASKKSLVALSKRIADILFEHNIPFEVKSRVKSIYSIYEKMYHKGKAFDEIYDVLALRIICDTELQCYEVLGLIHQVYRPIPGRFKDYIAMPKPNMYQSLHTSIVSGDGNVYEIQIRTKEMDQTAESGIAAHWAYKEGSYNAQKEQKEIENQLHWFRDFVSMSGEQDENAQEYMDSLTNDIFGANVYVFTPKGKVVELPNGATPLDFAYKIHTHVGDSATGAIVNKIMVPLNTKLKTGDMVEIRTSKNPSGPNSRWLDFVVTSHAKACIRKYLIKKNADIMREENISKAKGVCLDAFRERGVTNETEMMNFISDKKVLDNFNFPNVDELLLGVAVRKPTPSAIVDFLGLKRINPNPIVNKGKQISNDDLPVYCKGVGKIAISLASCCTPIPGDDIVGYITKGKGITVHRTNCPNIANEKVRLISVFWKDNLGEQTYPVDIIVEASDRPSLLADVLNVLSSQKITCTSVHAKLNTTTYITNVNLTIYVTNTDKLNSVFNLIANVSGVLKISRLIH